MAAACVQVNSAEVVVQWQAVQVCGRVVQVQVVAAVVVVRQQER